MKESIYTIPISEAFEAKQGCPFCALRLELERHWIEYITGPAMMEPDVRLETNKSGFCGHHYNLMLEQRNRLSVALMLQTHLGKLCEDFSAPKIRPGFGKKTDNPEENCFVCGRIRREFERILENVVVVWARDEDFQKMYIQQEYVCLPDCKRAVAAAGRKLRGNKLVEFSKITTDMALKKMVSLKSDVDAFCRLYDYRSVGGPEPSEQTASAIERAISFLAPPDNLK